jgi:hypothetical protein
VDGVVLLNQSTIIASGGFPYTISQRGSYKLSGPLVVPDGVNGIFITASNVTLDLNGFSIEGSCTSRICFNTGIQIGATNNNPKAITIRNGVISGFDGGINLTFSDHDIVEDLHIIASGSGTGTSFLFHHVTTTGTLDLACPGLASDLVVLRYTVTGAGCVLSNIANQF